MCRVAAVFIVAGRGLPGLSMCVFVWIPADLTFEGLKACVWLCHAKPCQSLDPYGLFPYEEEEEEDKGASAAALSSPRQRLLRPVGGRRL